LKLKLKKPDITDIVFVDVNNWNYVMRNNGSYMYDNPDADENGNNAGGEFPRGSGITIVYAGGLYIGTLKNGVEVVSETEFSTEFQPGAITNSGFPFAQLTADNSLSQENQVYEVDRSLSGDDYANWPALAPVTAANVPAVIADAQTWAIFNDLDITLSSEGPNDSPNPGLGMQVVLESFAFNAGPLSDVVYFKFTITNKTNVDYPDSYLGMWMDADVNNSSNDIVGVDTSRGLGYVYNETNEGAGADFATGFDFFQGPVVNTTEVSAALATKFAGNDTVLVYDPARNIYVATLLPAGKIWLGATSFNTYANGTDPIDNRERYNLLKGADKSSGVQKFGCGINDYYAFRGNPLLFPVGGSCDVAGAGSLSPNSAAADQRILHGVGPFTIKHEESQEIWVGVVGAGGTNRLNAVSNMWSTDDLAQKTFDAGLVAPAPPPAPVIMVYSSDRKVNITWQNNAEGVEDIAGEIIGINTGNGYSADYIPYDFQGYRVWKSLTGLPGSYQMVAQYDLADGITRVQNLIFNTEGDVSITYEDIGTDNGLRYSYTDEDVINGQKYFYSVSAYDAQPYIGGGPGNPMVGSPVDGTPIPKPTGLPISLQSAQTANVVAVVPWHASATNLQNNATVPSEADHSAGTSDGTVELEVFDQAAVEDADYKIQFFNLPDSVQVNGVWHLVAYNVDVLDAHGDPILHAGKQVYEVLKDGATTPALISSKNDDPRTFLDSNRNGVLDLDPQGNILTSSGDKIYDDRYYSTGIGKPGDATTEQFDWIDGILLRVYGPALEVKGWDYTGGNGTGARWFTGINFGLEQFFGGLSIGPNFLGATIADDAYRDVDIVFSTDTTGWSLIYGHVGAYGLNNETIVAPFKIFEVDPTDGDATPVQVNATMRDQNNRNMWLLDETLGGDGLGPQTRVYLHITNRPYDAGAQDPVLWGHSVDETPTMFSMDFTSRNAEAVAWNLLARTAVGAGSDGGTTITAAERSSIYSQIPDDGTFHILANHIIISYVDEFSFTSTARTEATKAQAKSTMKDIRVVPNPYYGRSTYQASLFDKRVKFTNLPAECTIKIFTVSGDLVKTLVHNNQTNGDVQNGNDRRNTNPLNLFAEPDANFTALETWNLQNEDGKFVASGMYIALVEAKGVGKKLVKFAVIQEEIQINGPDNR
jgi:hypothetical protein